MPKEHVPFQAYGLLRRIDGKGPQLVRRHYVGVDEAADYLVTRGLATSTLSESGDRIESTGAGSTVGLIEFDPAVGQCVDGP